MAPDMRAGDGEAGTGRSHSFGAATVPVLHVGEQLVNASNVEAAVGRQGADNFTSRMYWDRSPAAAPTNTSPATCGVR